MLFGKRGKSGLVALNLDLAEVAGFVKERLGKEVEMSGCKGPINTFIVEPFVPHNEEFYLNIVSERLGCSISFSECGGIDIEENWDKVRLSTLPFFGDFVSYIFLARVLKPRVHFFYRLKPYICQQEFLSHQKSVLHLLLPFPWR